MLTLMSKCQLSEVFSTEAHKQHLDDTFGHFLILILDNRNITLIRKVSNLVADFVVCGVLTLHRGGTVMHKSEG